ncbi:MAG TPA: hypothetical protein VFF80_04245 [Bacillota bacterium]|nr:hypothetical protein [Bacillota bacterium]
MKTNDRKIDNLSKRELSLIALFLIVLCVTLLDLVYLPILQDYRSSKLFYQQTLDRIGSTDGGEQIEQLNQEITQLQQRLATPPASALAAFSSAEFLRLLDTAAEQSGVLIQLIELGEQNPAETVRATSEAAFRLEASGSYSQIFRFLQCWYCFDRLILSDTWSIDQPEADPTKENLLRFETSGKILIDQGGLSNAEAEELLSESPNRNPFAQR